MLLGTVSFVHIPTRVLCNVVLDIGLQLLVLKSCATHLMSQIPCKMTEIVKVKFETGSTNDLPARPWPGRSTTMPWYHHFWGSLVTAVFAVPKHVVIILR